MQTLRFSKGLAVKGSQAVASAEAVKKWAKEMVQGAL